MIDSSTVLDPTAIVTKIRRVQVKHTGERLMESERELPCLLKIGRKRLHISSKKKKKQILKNYQTLFSCINCGLIRYIQRQNLMILLNCVNDRGRSDKSLRKIRKNVIRKELGILSISENANTVNNIIHITNNIQYRIRDNNSDSINNKLVNSKQKNYNNKR